MALKLSSSAILLATGLALKTESVTSSLVITTDSELRVKTNGTIQTFSTVADAPTKDQSLSQPENDPETSTGQ